MGQNTSPFTQNALLDGLPADEWALLKVDLQFVELPGQTTLHEAHRRLERAYFPLKGSVSLRIELADGFSVEAAQIGREGLVGAALALGRTESVTLAKVQLAVSALRITAEALVEHLATLPTLRGRVLHYTATQAARSMQLIACNAHHSLDARLARCLLGLHDRSAGQPITVTHEDLAATLCAHRPSVSVALKRLERQGLVRTRVGTLTVADRAGLEQASCECYAIGHASEGSGG